MKPEETFLKEVKNDIFNSGILKHEKINEKIDLENYQDAIIDSITSADFNNISLLQLSSKCITDIKNGKCVCDTHKKNIPDISKTNTNAVKLIFSQIGSKKTNLRKFKN